MSTEPDDLTVTLDPNDLEVPAEPDDLTLDLGADGAGTTPAAEPAPTQPDPVLTADDGIAALKQQVAEAKALAEAERRRSADEAKRRADAERRAAESEEQVVRFRSEAEQADYNAIISALDALTKEADSAQANLVRLLEAGDYAGAGEAQRKISQAEARIMRLEDGKSALEARQRAPKPEPQRQQPQRQEAPDDPVEAYIAQFTPRSQNWLRQNKSYASDPKLNQRLIAAHHEALAESYIPDSDAYFAFLSDRLGLTEKAPEPTPAPAQTRRAPAVAAPVSRSVPSGSNGQKLGNTITLTPQEREAAQIAGLSPAEYAKQLIRGVNAGEITRHH